MRERDGSADIVDGQETVGNSLERSIGRERDGSVDAKTVIAWGELHWEGARWKRRQGGRTGSRGK